MKHWMTFLLVVVFVSSGCMSAEAVTTKPKKETVTPYPLDTCPITGSKLGSMGDPVVKVYDGREVKFCCAGCPPEFEKDLTASFKKLDAGIKEAKPAGAAKPEASAHHQMMERGKVGSADVRPMACCAMMDPKTKADAKPMAGCAMMDPKTKADAKPMAGCAMMAEKTGAKPMAGCAMMDSRTKAGAKPMAGCKMMAAKGDAAMGKTGSAGCKCEMKKPAEAKK